MPERSARSWREGQERRLEAVGVGVVPVAGFFKEVGMMKQQRIKVLERNGFVMRKHPLRTAWFRVLDLAVRLLSFGAARVFPVDREICFQRK